MASTVARETALFLSLYITGLVGLGVLVAVFRGQPPFEALVALVTDPVWVFVTVLGAAIWILLYPKQRRTYQAD